MFLTSFKVSQVSAEAFLSHHFLGSQAFALASQRCPQKQAYCRSLRKLLQREGEHLTITETAYSLSSAAVRLFDIKVKHRFEDDIVERIYKDWNKEEVEICPLRRGICLGLINDSTLLLAVGNAKIFYAESEKQLLDMRDATRLVLCEKANGEYTMLSSARLEDGSQWLLFGSKNVRLALPFEEQSPERTLTALDAVMQQQHEGQRFSYLAEMIPLWLSRLTRKVLDELELGSTLVGEQVGVHEHIYTGYSQPEIRLFASLRHEHLTSQLGCDLHALRDADLGPAMVKFTTFNLPSTREECAQALQEIASGSMHVYGEGVVVYAYDDSKAEARLLGMYKYKCEEYAFDRKLRTLLAILARDLARAPVTKLCLREQAERITKSLSTGFDRMSAERRRARLELIPCLVAFLDRHQCTMTTYGRDFEGNFVDAVRATEARKEEYARFAQEHFMQVEDAFLPEFQAFLQRFASVDVECRAVRELAEYIIDAWQARGGAQAFPMLGIAASVGAGKTTILREVQSLLTARGMASTFCDRDAYMAEDPTALPHVVHNKWTKDICALTQQQGTHVVLVGNTFAGGLAQQLEKLTGRRILLFAFTEFGDGGAELFALECLRRLSRRVDAFADGSTLTMQVGSNIVLAKYFSFSTDALLPRIKQGSLVPLPSPIVQATRSSSNKELQQALIALKKRVNALASKNSNKRARVEVGTDADFKPKIPRAVLPPTAATTDLELDKLPIPVLFTALLPTREECKALQAMVSNVGLIRTDAHLTLKYNPTREDLQAALDLFGARTVDLLCTHLCTCFWAQDCLEFVVLKDESKLLFLPHITLGSTDYEKLPAVTSKLVLERLGGELDKAEHAVELPSGQTLRVIVRALDATLATARLHTSLMFYSGKV